MRIFSTAGCPELHIWSTGPLRLRPAPYLAETPYDADLSDAVAVGVALAEDDGNTMAELRRARAEREDAKLIDGLPVEAFVDAA